MLLSVRDLSNKCLIFNFCNVTGLILISESCERLRYRVNMKLIIAILKFSKYIMVFFSTLRRELFGVVGNQHYTWECIFSYFSNDLRKKTKYKNKARYICDFRITFFSFLSSP